MPFSPPSSGSLWFSRLGLTCWRLMHHDCFLHPPCPRHFAGHMCWIHRCTGTRSGAISGMDDCRSSRALKRQVTLARKSLKKRALKKRVPCTFPSTPADSASPQLEMGAAASGRLSLSLLLYRILYLGGIQRTPCFSFFWLILYFFIFQIRRFCYFLVCVCVCVCVSFLLLILFVSF